MSQYDNPEWMKTYKKVIREQLLEFHRGENTAIPYRIAEEYFPADIERQVDLCMAIGEAIGRAEELDYPKGVIPTDLFIQIAKKYKVEKIFDVEMVKLRSDGLTGIIEEDKYI